MNELQRRTLANLEQRLNQVGVLPAVVSRLLALDLDSPAASDEIMRLCRADPGLALRLLRLANSALVAGAAPVDTIPDAILRVGTRRLAEMILSASVVQVFLPRTRGQQLLWIHSMQTAVWARRIVEMRPDCGVTAEEAYLAGLLHDIGRFLMFQHSRDELGRIEESAFGDPRQLVAAEVDLCGFDHAHLGWHVCRQWLLPETVSDMVRHHHVYGKRVKEIPSEVSTLVQVVQQADHLSCGILSPAPHVDRHDVHAVSEGSLRSLDGGRLLLPLSQVTDQFSSAEQQVSLAADLVGLVYGHDVH